MKQEAVVAKDSFKILIDSLHAISTAVLYLDLDRSSKTPINVPNLHINFRAIMKFHILILLNLNFNRFYC